MSLNDGTSAPPPTDARAWQHTTCVAHALGFADVRSRVRNGAVARRWRDASMHAAAWPECLAAQRSAAMAAGDVWVIRLGC